MVSWWGNPFSLARGRIAYLFSDAIPSRMRRLISVCFGLPSMAKRISASVLIFRFKLIIVVFAFIQALFASVLGIDFAPLIVYNFYQKAACHCSGGRP